MDTITLKPHQLIAPGEYEIGNENLLKIYFRIYERRRGNILPPLIVAHKDSIDLRIDISTIPQAYSNAWGELVENINYSLEVQEAKFYNETLEEKFSEGADYFLLDGNHRALAATLTHSPLIAWAVATDEDLAKGKKWEEDGTFFNWNIPGQTMEEVRQNLQDALKSFIHTADLDFDPGINSAVSLTFHERVEQLVQTRALPDYMIRKYLRKS